LTAAVAPQETPVTRVQNYMLEHLDEAFSIERMAGLATMSPRHFARVFAREVNMTPMEFCKCANRLCQEPAGNQRPAAQDRGLQKWFRQRAAHAFSVQ